MEIQTKLQSSGACYCDVFYSHFDPHNNRNGQMSKDRLEYIHTIEQRIMNHTRFQDFCFKDSVIAWKDPALKTIGDCAPLNSLMQYFYPTIDDNENIHYDGLGSMLADIKSTIKFAKLYVYIPNDLL
jgi:hypothetical protein